MRTNISSGAPWESIVGYSRAVRVGNMIEVAGTTAVDGDQLVGEGNAYEQSRFIFAKIQTALEQAGSSMRDVVRTRMYVTTSNVIDDVLRAHGEVFMDIRPVATLVVVSALINDKLLVEIEASAIIDPDRSV
ncbi:MAG: RidA family protein [Ignavibacteria bacterium]|nr:RidA family protein [Ignavibacteria bacterium]MBP6510299.1 RidA family protein [Candidatus Kapabacteria bacterium]MBK6419466.1 RidA family protein [Ignavibacteria bacterium]MBK6759906.1 RidA family protein [Ignavibacteria bacterium]MBK7184791.1 RidA family protein [Ignavibacteria bacterium]